MQQVCVACVRWTLFWSPGLKSESRLGAVCYLFKMIISVVVLFFFFFISLQLSVKNCFIRGSVVRYVQLPADEVDTQLLQDAARKEAMQQKQWWLTSGGRSLERGLSELGSRSVVVNNNDMSFFWFWHDGIDGFYRIVVLFAFQKINHLHWAAIILNQFLTFFWMSLFFVFNRWNSSSTLLFKFNNKHCCVCNAK